MVGIQLFLWTPQLFDGQFPAIFVSQTYDGLWIIMDLGSLPLMLSHDMDLLRAAFDPLERFSPAATAAH